MTQQNWSEYSPVWILEWIIFIGLRCLARVASRAAGGEFNPVPSRVFITRRVPTSPASVGRSAHRGSPQAQATLERDVLVEISGFGEGGGCGLIRIGIAVLRSRSDDFPALEVIEVSAVILAPTDIE